MEAEDTVMSSNDRHCCTTTRDMCERQAEISFKAGIREVVEWVNAQDYELFRTGYVNKPEVWQAKLKEWGIDGDKV